MQYWWCVVLDPHRAALSLWDMPRGGSWQWRTSTELCAGATWRWACCNAHTSGLSQSVCTVSLIWHKHATVVIAFSLFIWVCSSGYLWLRGPGCSSLPLSERRRAFLHRGSGHQPGRVGFGHQHSQGLCWDHGARYDPTHVINYCQKYPCCWKLMIQVFESGDILYQSFLPYSSPASECVLPGWERQPGASGDRWGSAKLWLTRS